jgi:NAD-dependent deacetylase
MTPYDYKNIVVLTGAGVSAESGLGTFRGEDGLWTKYDMDEVVSIEGFKRNPDYCHEYYNARRAQFMKAKPNQAHRAIARLEAKMAGRGDDRHFGELAFDTDRIYAALRTCDLFLSIGTSSNIYPAAGFIEEVRLAGQAHTVELNLEPSMDVDLLAEQRLGLATKVVPAYVEQILAEI